MRATLDAGALPIVIGQNSPCGSYAIAKPIAERSRGNVGHISIDTHWDSQPIDRLTMDPRIAGSGSWKAKMYEFHKNFTPQNMVEIGERAIGGVIMKPCDPRRARADQQLRDIAAREPAG